MLRTSEWVSLGHPDKTADYISSYLLDRYLEHNPDTRYAVEVQIKDTHVTLGGEVASAYAMGDDEITRHVHAAVRDIGYTADYLALWGEANAISGDDLEVSIHIGRQSPDIARGVDRDGWGDQGIFWGMAVNDPSTGFMPRDHWLAKSIGEGIVNCGFGGLDVKTLVTLDDGIVTSVVAAVPLLDNDTGHVETLVRAAVGNAAAVTINGTGRFTVHASMGDCGTTGRKLAVDLYGGNCRIGGGSPWTKDGTKADLTLNLYARKKALDYLRSHHGVETVYCAISCCIGSPVIRVALFDGQNRQLESYSESRRTEDLVREFGLREPKFARLCRKGLFSDIA